MGVVAIFSERGKAEVQLTGDSYSSAEVARMSAAALTKRDVEGIRTGRIPDPTVGQVAALAAAFGVAPPTWWTRARIPRFLMRRRSRSYRMRRPALYIKESATLPEREKEVVLGIVRHFAGRPE